MMPASLAESLRPVHALLRGELSPEGLEAATGIDAVRSGAYQRFVGAHIRAVLEKSFDVLPSVLGEPLWSDMVEGYFRTHPPRDYELNACAAALPAYLEDRARFDRRLVPFHLELARLEWTEAKIALVPDPAPPEKPTRLNPVLEVLELAYPVASFVRDHRAGMRPPMPSPGRELAFVFRHPETGAYVTLVADAGLLFAFKVAHDALSLEAAAAASGLDIPAVRSLLAGAEALGLLLRAPRDTTFTTPIGGIP